MIPTRDIELERKYFEQTIRGKGLRPGSHLKRGRSGHYLDNRIAAKWSVWLQRAMLDGWIKLEQAT